MNLLTQARTQPPDPTALLPIPKVWVPVDWGVFEEDHPLAGLFGYTSRRRGLMSTYHTDWGFCWEEAAGD